MKLNPGIIALLAITVLLAGVVILNAILGTGPGAEEHVEPTHEEVDAVQENNQEGSEIHTEEPASDETH